MFDPQTLDEIDVLTRTVFGEARGESAEGQAAVAWVIRNRVTKNRRYLGRTVKEVCLMPHQFSCWNTNDSNRQKLLQPDTSDKTYVQILRIVEQVMNGTIKDNTQGSMHYHTDRVKPNWVTDKTPVVTIGHHLFYNDIN